MKHILFFIIPIFFISCSNNLIYSEIKPIENKTFSIDSTYLFNFSISNDGIGDNDTLTSEVLVRHTGNYEFQNLWLFMTYILPDSSVVCDTVNMYFANNFGYWIGDSGIGSLYTVTVPSPKQIITKEGNYTISIEQGMRMENVNNITDIGFNVYKK